MKDAPKPSRDFAAYQRETVRLVLERQAGVFTLVLSVALAVDAIRLHPSPAFATILARLPWQIAVCAGVFLAMRYSVVGKRWPTILGTLGYATVAGIGGRLLGDLGGFDGPFFYGVYVLPTFIMVLPCPLTDRIVMTLTTVGAFVSAFFWPHPAHLEYRFAHIALGYLAAIMAVDIFFGHRAMLILRERFEMERTLERHGETLARDNRQLEERVRHQTGSVRSLLDRIETMQQDARTELARDLHDGMGQLVVGTRLELHQIERALGSGEGLSTEHLGYLHGLVDRLDRQVRDMVTELRDPSAVGSLERALGKLGAAYTCPPEMTVSLDVALAFEPTEALSEVIVAVTREALTNAAKHARARRVDVRVRTDAEAIHLEVEDDGTAGASAVSAAPAAGFGLVGMRERVARVHGELGFDHPGANGRRGTRVWARFGPLPSGHDDEAVRA